MKRKVILQLLLIAISIGFIVAGVLLGNVNAVLNKAIAICLECIGIG